MHIEVISPTSVSVNNMIYPCATGAGGLVSFKREGDEATPMGTFPLRRLFYRPDRLERPVTSLPIVEITPDMGWCDDIDSAQYNKLVSLPFSHHHEVLWREDPVYDLLIEVGYNDAPAVPGRGSAIFIHVAREDYSPTQGCVAIKLYHLLDICLYLTVASCLKISDNRANI